MAALILDSWAGRREIPVKVLDHKRKRTKIELLADALLPSGRRFEKGAVVWVSSFAVREDARPADE